MHAVSSPAGRAGTLGVPGAAPTPRRAVLAAAASVGTSTSSAPGACRAPSPPQPPPLLVTRAVALAAALALTLASPLAPAVAEEAAAAAAVAAAAAAPAATADPAPPSTAKAAARAVSGALSRFLKSRHAADGGARLLGPVRASGDRLRQAAVALLDAEAGAEAEAVATAKRGLRGAPPPVRAKAKKGGQAGVGGAGGAPAASPPLPPRAYAAVLRLVRAASFECFSFDALDGAVALPGSLSAGGGGRCTLQIVAREAVRSLGQDQAALGAATADEADALARALQLLDDRLDRAAEGDGAAAAGVAEAMERALRVQTAFQGLIERCLFE